MVAFVAVGMCVVVVVAARTFADASAAVGTDEIVEAFEGSPAVAVVVVAVVVVAAAADGGAVASEDAL